jgi:hypothetical protein
VASHRADTQPLPRRRDLRASRSPRKVTRRGQSSLTAPQVGIASALGLATIAAPLTGAMAGEAPKTVSNTIQMRAVPAAPEFPAVSSSPLAVQALQVVPVEAGSSASVPAMLTAPRTMLVSRASRASERPVLPGCTGQYTPHSVANGALPAQDLCTLWDPKHRLRADAAVALARLNIAYQQRFGHRICLTDSYRSLSEQRSLKAIKPGLAATPGTSEHGWGLAVDLCDGVNSSASATYKWLRDNGPSYGWGNPDWARVGGSGPNEPWHWEFTPSR